MLVLWVKRPSKIAIRGGAIPGAQTLVLRRKRDYRKLPMAYHTVKEKVGAGVRALHPVEILAMNHHPPDRPLHPRSKSPPQRPQSHRRSKPAGHRPWPTILTRKEFVSAYPLLHPPRQPDPNCLRQMSLLPLGPRHRRRQRLLRSRPLSGHTLAGWTLPSLPVAFQEPEGILRWR